MGNAGSGIFVRHRQYGNSLYRSTTLTLVRRCALKNNIIIALVGRTQVGKTTLAYEVTKRLPRLVSIIKSDTTRARKDNGLDPLFFNCIPERHFHRKRVHGRYTEYEEHGAGKYYACDTQEVKEVLRSSHGILALNQKGVLNFQRANYLVFAVKVIPRFREENLTELFYEKHPERKKADDEQEKIPIRCALELNNDFAPGGKEATVTLFAEWIQHSVTK